MIRPLHDDGEDAIVSASPTTRLPWPTPMQVRLFDHFGMTSAPRGAPHDQAVHHGRTFKVSVEGVEPSPAPLPTLPSVTRCITSSQSARSDKPRPTTGVALHFVDRSIPTLTPRPPTGAVAPPHVGTARAPPPPLHARSSIHNTGAVKPSGPSDVQFKQQKRTGSETSSRSSSPPSPPSRVASAKAAREAAAVAQAPDLTITSITDRNMLRNLCAGVDQSVLQPARVRGGSTLISEAAHDEALRAAMLQLTLRFDAALQEIMKGGVIAVVVAPTRHSTLPSNRAAARPTRQRSDEPDVPLPPSSRTDPKLGTPTTSSGIADGPKRALRLTHPKWPFTNPPSTVDATRPAPLRHMGGAPSSRFEDVVIHESLGRWTTRPATADDDSSSTTAQRLGARQGGESPSRGRIVTVAKGFDDRGTPVDIAMVVTPRSKSRKKSPSPSTSPGAPSIRLQIPAQSPTVNLDEQPVSMSPGMEKSTLLTAGESSLGSSRRPSSLDAGGGAVSSFFNHEAASARERSLRDLLQALLQRRESLEGSVSNLQRLIHRQRQANNNAARVVPAPPSFTPTTQPLPPHPLPQSVGMLANRRDSVASVHSDVSSDGGRAVEEISEALQTEGAKGMHYFVASQATTMNSAINKALGPMSAQTPTRGGTSTASKGNAHIADDRVRALLQRAAERCADLADKCRKRTQNTQAIAGYLAQYLAETTMSAASASAFAFSDSTNPFPATPKGRAAGTPLMARSIRRSSVSVSADDGAAASPNRPLVQLADVLPAVAMPMTCTKDVQVAKVLKTNAEALTNRINDLTTKLKIMQQQSDGTMSDAKRNVLNEFDEKARALPALPPPPPSASDGPTPSATPRAVKSVRRSDEGDEKRMDALRKALLGTRDDRDIMAGAVGPPRRGAFSNVRHAEVQNTIEDELAVYLHGRATALLAKERAVTRAFHNVQTCMANICGYTENIEVVLTCQRCWKVFADPHIVAPCGLTVCGACIIPTDEAAASEAVLECGCTVHEGLVPNDGVTGAVERWSELDRIATDLVYSMKTLGVGLLPCYSSKTETVRTVDEASAVVKENRIRISSSTHTAFTATAAAGASQPEPSNKW